MDRTDEQATIHRNGRLAANIRAGQSPLTPELIETMRHNAKAGRDIPGPRVLQLLDELQRITRTTKESTMASADRDENMISTDGGKTWHPCPGCPDCETSDG